MIQIDQALHQDAPVCRILVLRPNHRLGNTLLLTPLIQELEHRYPGAEIDLVVAGAVANAVFLRYPQVRIRYVFPADSFRHPLQVLATFMQLRRNFYDIAIDPSPHSRSARFMLAWVRAREKLGFLWRHRWCNLMLTRGVPVDAAPHGVAAKPVYLLRTARLEVCASTSSSIASLPLLDLRLSATERRIGQQRVRRLLADAQSPSVLRIGLYCYATGRKSYPRAWWQAIVAGVRQVVPNAAILEIVPHDGRPRLDGRLPALYSADARSLGGALAALDLCVSADCGVMHLAAASGASVLGAFKVTDPGRYGPYGAGNASLIASDTEPNAVIAQILANLSLSHGSGCPNAACAVSGKSEKTPPGA
jgi:heptosyltransferase III